MGEIKSTLDLVMDRTRHLTLSDEEKKHQQAADFEKRLQGLLQQYADGALGLEDLRARLTGIQAEMQIEDRRMVIAGVVGRIDPDGDNAPWLALLDREASELGESLQNILAAHRRKRSAILEAGKQGQRDRLSGEHAIAGTAVAPNPDQDPACRQGLADLRRRTLERIAALRDQQVL
jgi:hypothetical protein